jgi:hypothetical protein
MNIRGKSISFASWKKNEQLENELQESIVNLENKIQIQYSDTLEKQLRENNKKLENIRKLKMMRAKAQIIEEGEKPSTYFIGLEHRNFVNKAITAKIEKIIMEQLSLIKIL